MTWTPVPFFAETRTLTKETETTEIIGEIETITYRNEENGWSVVKVQLENGRSVTVTGQFIHLRVGEHFRMEGIWTEHKVHGRQFKSQKASVAQPTSQEGLVKYLSSGLIKGIGKITARKIVKHFKENTLNILNNDPDRITEVDSIGPMKAKTIIASWKESQEFRDAELFLLSHDISPALTNKIIKVYRRRTIDVVRHEPYRLCNEISGVGFITADKIAQSLGIAKDARERISAGLLYVIRQSEDQGHCYLFTEQILESLSHLLDIQQESISDQIVEILQDLNRQGSIVSETHQNTSIHYLFDLALAESAMSQKVSKLLGTELSVDENRIDSWLDRYAKLANQPFVKQAAICG